MSAQQITNILLMTISVTLFGCGLSQPAPQNVTPSVATSIQAPAADQEEIKKHLEGWLEEQRRARGGENYWDEYTRTPNDAPNLSKYAEIKSKLNTSMNELYRHDGKEDKVIETIDHFETLNAVRSWEVLNVKISNLNEAQQQDCARDEMALAKVRIESSKADGTPIIQIWSFGLFKNKGRWGIFSLSKSL